MVWGSICLASSNLLTARYVVTVLIQAGKEDMPMPLAGHAREALMSPQEGGWRAERRSPYGVRDPF